jgi:hypothetical protein
MCESNSRRYAGGGEKWRCHMTTFMESVVEHDPEKHVLGLRPDGWVPVFPRDKRGTRLRGDHAQKIGYSGKLLTFLTHARTSTSTSGSTDLTSSAVIPALMRGS